MTTVDQFVSRFNRNYHNLNTNLVDLRYIGPHISGRAIDFQGWFTVGDLARWARGKTGQQVHDALSLVARNRRANTCVDYGVAGGPQNNQLASDYHIPIINMRGYNTLRNLLEAVRKHYAAFRRHLPQDLPELLNARDLGSQVCSCVTDRNQCTDLARRGVCTWRDRRCKPRETSLHAAFRGAASLAGQHASQGRRVAGMRFKNGWRIPDNR